MDNNEKNKMLEELQQLLEKYNVTIAFECDEGSDTYGLYGESIVVLDRYENELFKVKEYCIDKNSFKK